MWLWRIKLVIFQKFHSKLNKFFLLKGEAVKDVHPTRHSSCSPAGLAWHPSRRTLVSSWENGEIRLWNGEKEFGSISSPHTSPVVLVRWSQMGGRLVTIDSVSKFLLLKFNINKV